MNDLGLRSSLLRAKFKMSEYDSFGVSILVFRPCSGNLCVHVSIRFLFNYLFIMQGVQVGTRMTNAVFKTILLLFTNCFCLKTA